jgi:hypothetical protein
MSKIIVMYKTNFTLGLLIVSVIALSLHSTAWADDINPGIFSTDSQPYGLTYEDWGKKWWQWFISLPEDQNPLNDETGEKCQNGQVDPNVWYLTGTGGGTVTRSCTLPNGTSVLISVAGNSCAYSEYPNLSSEKELRDCAIAGNQVDRLEVFVDGRKLEDVRNYHATSDLFTEDFPENNLWDVKPGPTEAVYDSYLLFLEPLSIGNHTIRFLQNTVLGDVGNYAYDVTYLLNVEEPVG